MKPLSPRLTAMTCAVALLAGCTTPAHTQHAQTTVPADAVWPAVSSPAWAAHQPAHQQSAAARPWQAAWLDRPQFQAPSATHCARGIQTVQWPPYPQPTGQHGSGSWPAGRPDTAHGSRPMLAAPAEAAREASRDRAARAEAERAPATALPAPPPPAPASASAPPPAAKASSEAVAADMAYPAPHAPSHAVTRQRPPQTGPVTAGMVDDNADFGAYLAFRDRTPVPHLPRDVRERYLLQVNDAGGQPLADAEVAVQAESGHAMWARTDTAGRVWIHPNAFDPVHSQTYRVMARRHGSEGVAWLTRGQKSTVELRLGNPGPAQRARLDLVFLIDATGSMADEIHKLKLSLQTIVSDLSRLPSQPDLCLGLVAYRDEGDAFTWRRHDLTGDVGAFQGVLNQLHADGGGDYPEAMSEAFNQTVHQISWRGDGATRLVVLLADAPPQLRRAGPRYDQDMLAALGKGIKVFAVGASGLDRQGEYIQRQIAQYTGGRFVFLTYANARRPASGPGRETVHDVSNYSVDTLDRLIVRLVGDELARLPNPAAGLTGQR